MSTPYRSNYNKSISTIAIALSAVLTFSASSAFADEERAIAATETRQGLLKVVGSYFGPIYAMVQGHIDFDGAVVQHNASKIAQLGEMLPDTFRMDTSGYDVETETLDGVWENMDDFKAKAATLVEKATALSAAGAQGAEATAMAFRATGGSCKACHDEYREQ